MVHINRFPLCDIKQVWYLLNYCVRLHIVTNTNWLCSSFFSLLLRASFVANIVKMMKGNASNAGEEISRQKGILSAHFFHDKMANSDIVRELREVTRRPDFPGITSSATTEARNSSHLEIFEYLCIRAFIHFRCTRRAVFRSNQFFEKCIIKEIVKIIRRFLFNAVLLS